MMIVFHSSLLDQRSLRLTVMVPSHRIAPAARVLLSENLSLSFLSL